METAAFHTFGYDPVEAVQFACNVHKLHFLN